jgi:U32 family peptidase
MVQAPVRYTVVQEQKHRIELLAPAGDPEAMRAAVANGADAVYFGLTNFNARHRADNVAGTGLAETLSYLHSHNVRGYVAFNTLIFSDELEQAATCIRDIAGSGADAVIVQDLGLCHLIGLMTPSLDRHASTQMTLSDARGIEVVTKLGIGRVILARELSIADISKITQTTRTPVEVFCHGALCVAYSGQCLTSESIGGRSANRGQCAQACRLPYEVIVDGSGMDQAGRQFLLSPQDLAAYDRVAELASAGVSSLKIEGRLKSGQYVAATTSAYRAAIDAATSGLQFHLSTDHQAYLTQSFSRGFTHGFLDGVNHQVLVQGTFSKKRGMQMGKVLGHTPEGILVQLAPGRAIRPGDGIVFDEGHPEQDEQGGRVYEVRPAKGGMELRFGHGAVVHSAVGVGALVWKTDDPAINRKLQQTYSRDVVVHREKLRCSVRAVVGDKLFLRLMDHEGRQVTAQTDGPVEAARKFPLDETLVREQLGRLGDTPYELGEVHLHGRSEADPPEPVMAPKSVLNELRRQATAKLIEMRGAAREHAITSPGALDELRGRIASAYAPATAGAAEAKPQLVVLVRTMEQLRAATQFGGLAMIWCDFEDVRRYKEAVEVARAAGRTIGLATMRVTKPGEEGFLKQIAECAPDALLVRNLSSLSYFAQAYPGIELVADYSLNVANELTAWVLMQGMGWRPEGSSSRLARLTPSHDLNAAQLEAMLKRISGGVFEAVLHQHMAMFHMEHCVFAHMLSNGRDYRDCGRPCEKHRVSLRDRVGVEHPLQADAGCRNTVFNGRPQSIAAYVPMLLERGVQHFRVELLQESERETQDLLRYYSGVLAGRSSIQRPRTKLKVMNLMGVTPGTMEFD